MNESHWGLIIMDLLNRRLLFDDGYKLQPDRCLLPNVKNMLDIFQQLRPGALCFQNAFWDSIHQFDHFVCHLNMDVQEQVRVLEAVV